MKNTSIVRLTFIFILLTLSVPSAVLASAYLQAELPPEGWTVCEVGGLEQISAVGELRQVFRLCRADGWTVKAYCTDPGVEPPALNTGCSLLEGDIFWCGDAVQELAVLAVLQTPPPTQTPTPLPTETATLVPELTATPGNLQPTPEATIAPTQPAPTATVPQDTGTKDIIRTRPAPGGPGNVTIVTFGLMGLAVGWGAGVWWIFLRRRSGRP